MTDRTAIPADDDDLEVDAKRVDDEVAPEEKLLEGWLPVARDHAVSGAARRRTLRTRRFHAFRSIHRFGNSASADAG